MRSLFQYGLIFSIFGMAIACGGNLFETLVEPGNDQTRIEEAERLIDEKKFTKALGVLDEVKGNSNRRRTAEAAALLGAAGVGVWDILLNILDSPDQSSASISFDAIFDGLSEEFFGTGELRSAKVLAMQSSLAALLLAPDPNERQMKNISCFVGGILSVLTVTDGNQAISDVSSALATIQSSAIGSASNDDECPGVDDLESGLNRIGELRNSLALILSVTDGCGFIDLGASSPNRVEQQLNQLVTRSDLGCQAAPDCGPSEACQALSLGCVQSRIEISEAVAGDSQLASCELVQNCIGSDCFGTRP